jgi:hypothetical protein
VPKHPYALHPRAVATNEEIRAASLQYVNKISGCSKPLQANEEAFARAVDEVAATSKRLLAQLLTAAPPKDREVEAERAHAGRPSGSRRPEVAVTRVAVVGLGAMGSRVARRLIEAVNEVVVWNPGVAKTVPLTQAGAAAAEILERSR